MDEKIEKAIKPLLEMYENIENDLLIKIASHFKFNDEFLNSDHWRIKKLEEMGLFNEEVIDYISRYSGKSKKAVKKALEEIGIESVNISKLKGLFYDERLTINPNVLIENKVINDMIKHAYNETSERFIQISKKIEQSARESYLNIVEEAYLKTSTGTHSYQEAIRESINNLSNKGLNTLTYVTKDENGNVVGIRNYDVEGAVRREILTSSRQLNADINMEVANELDAEYLYISEHLRCRPTHFKWQGTVIPKEDLTKTPVEDYPAYGEVEGICGPNCGHYFEPFFGDPKSVKKKYSESQCEKAYNLSQKQRYLERGVRKWNRKVEMFKSNGDYDAYAKSKDKLNYWQLRSKHFSEDYKTQRDYTREYTYQTKNPKSLPTEESKLPSKIGFYDNDIGYTIIPKDVIITNTHIIAGKNTRTMFRKAKDYAKAYGGKPQDYYKVAGVIESDKYVFDIHFVRNNKGNEYSHKIAHKKVIK